MYRSSVSKPVDYIIILISGFLIAISVGLLQSILPSLFPLYLAYIVVGLVLYMLFARSDFKLLQTLYKHIYVVSLVFLALPLIIGEITRGAVRWIPIGNIAIQPSELVRPFLILFFATFLTSKELTFRRIMLSGFLFLVPATLILIQPSLGVTALTSVAYLGVLLASTVNKKYIFGVLGLMVLFAPLVWLIMADYQKERVVAFLNPGMDPLGAGYNSIQSMISVGSGGLLGRGLGEGVQTQLAFLPERHNDFIFASAAEELGLVGVVLILVCLFVLLWRLTVIMEISQSPTARAYVSGVFLVLFFQIVFNIGMNMGLFPITGIPLPLISAGGSSLMATMIALGIASSARR